MTTLSALVVARNEEARLPDCLGRLSFADEIVVVLDRCTDRSAEVARAVPKVRVIEGGWEREGPRRNDGIAACQGEWIVEIDADEWVSPELGTEIRSVIASSSFDIHLIPVDNWVGTRLVRYGWGASFGKGAYPGLFRKGTKQWGDQRVHPRLTLSDRRGPMLTSRLRHQLDRDISDMIRRFDRYSSARAQDLRESGNIPPIRSDIRRVFGRFYKCYFARKGWKEGGLGFLIAMLAGLYPLTSNLKARE